MSRSSIVLVAVAAALAATLGWLVVGRGEGRAAERSASATPTAGAEGERSARPTASALPAPGPSSAAHAAEEAPAASPARVELVEERLAGGPWLGGRVVLPPGAPAGERAWVVVTCPSKDGEKKESARAAVGADGTFRVALPPIETRALVSLDARTLYLERAVSLTAERAREPLVLEPAIGGWIDGTFAPPPGDDAAEAAAALAGSTLTCAPTARRAAGPRPPLEVQGLAFELHGIPPGADVRLTLSSERYYLLPATFPRVAAGERTPLTLALGTAATVEGRVLDESGLPRAEVKVTASAPRWSTRKATTAEDGTYRVGGIAPGPLTLRFEAGPFEQAQREIVLARDGEIRAGVDVVVPRGEAIEGRVLWPDGRPVAATLAVVDESAPFRSREIETEPDGTFRIGGKPGASYRLTADARLPAEAQDESAPARRRARWGVSLGGVRAGTKDVVLTLGPGLAIAGTVRDERGEPLDDFSIQAWQGQRTPGSWLGDAAREEHFSGVGGRFELLDLQPGPWLVQASTDELVASPRTQVEVQEGLVLDLVVPCPAVVEGVVQDPSGRGLPGASIALDAGEAGKTDRVADATGHFRVEAAGTIGLRASAPSYASSERIQLQLEPGASRSVTLALRRGGRITGLVVDAGGGGLAGSAVTVTGEGEFRSLTSDASGGFVAEGLMPGSYRIRAASTAEEIVARLGPDADRNAQRLLQREAQVELVLGEEPHVVLRPPELQPVRVHGRVSCAGRALGNATLFCLAGQRHSMAKADAEGGYELTVPAPGHYQLSVMHDESGLNGMLEVDVPARESFAQDIALAGGTIRGRVRGPDGPLAGIPVHASASATGQEQRRGGGSATTGADGRYELLVPIGTYLVSAPGESLWGVPPGESGAYCPVTVEDVHVTEGGEVRGIDLELRIGGSIEGHLLESSGATVSIVASDAQGQMLGFSYTDSASFRIDGLPPGRVTLRAEAHGEPRAALPVSVEIVAGATSAAELRFAPATRLEVRVRDASGAPAAVASASLETADGPVETAGPSEPGLVRLGAWPAGRYTLRVRAGARELVQEVRLDGRPTATVELHAE